MKHFKFSKTSQQRLNTCDPDLIAIMTLALEFSHVDFGISQGARTIEQQQQYFDERKSRVNPKDYSNPRELAKKAKHITIEGDPEFSKSRAVDIFAVVPNNKKMAYDHRTLSMIAGSVFAASNFLFDNQITDVKIRWGGDWDQDQTLVVDQNLVDLPHFEIFKSKNL